jgi:hypothetical protein
LAQDVSHDRDGPVDTWGNWDDPEGDLGGSVTILIRFSAGRGFSSQTTAVLQKWPLLARSGRREVRQPVALGQSAMTGSPTPQRR